MQGTWSQPVADVVVFSNDFASGGSVRVDRGRPRPARRAGLAEHRLLVVPPDPAHLEVVVPVERAGSAAVTPRSTTPKNRPKVAVAAPGPE